MRDESEETKAIGYPFDQPVFVVYTGDTQIRSADEVDFDQTVLGERIEALSRDGEIVAFRLIELLNAAVGVSEVEEFRLYKEFDPEKIDDALDRVEWGADAVTVAGDLMSNLILSHSLPNANHRTAIAMLQFCIECVDPTFSMPRTHLDDETWHDWVDPYIVRFKEIITVRRNNRRFHHLHELGVELVERKDGIRIDLTTFDLDMPIRQAHQTYARRHESLCHDFATEAISRSNRPSLAERSGPTRSDFIDYLESGEKARDLDRLF